MEWFSGTFSGAPADESIDGIRFLRRGHQWSVHWAAYRHYRESIARDFDVVVDEVNTMPFFTPLWAGIPSVMFIHQLAREVWWYESRFPISLLGYLAEPIYLQCYRSSPVITVSRSTEGDLRRLHFRGPIRIISEGIDTECDGADKKAVEPTFLCVGRIAPSKRLDHAISAFAMFLDAFGSGRLVLVGEGSASYKRRLVDLASRLGVSDRVSFSGRVDSAEKRRLMTEAHMLLACSVREGWGLVVSEASACGTPAIVYDVPGLRDSVQDQLTGLVVAPRPAALSEAMLRLIGDSDLYARLAAEGRRRSASLSFEESARSVAQTLEAVVAA